MYALIGCKEDGGEPVLLAMARTLKAAQRKWDIILGQMAVTKWKHPNWGPRYKFIGFLTEAGLTNYAGDHTSKSMIGHVTVKMGIEREVL